MYKVGVGLVINKLLPANNFTFTLCNRDFEFVRILDLSFGAGVIRTFLATSCFAGSHRVAIHTPGRKLYI